MAKPKYHQLSNDEVIKLYSELKSSEIGVYLYLASKHPFEDSKIEIDTSLIAEHLGFHRRTVQLAVNKLAELKYIEVDLVRFKYRIAKHGCNSKATVTSSSNEIRESEDRQSDLRIAVSESEDRQSDLRIAVSESEDRQSDLRIAVSESEDRQSDLRIAVSESEDRHRPSEPTNPSTSQTQQTLQTFKTNKTLSDLREETAENALVDPMPSLDKNSSSVPTEENGNAPTEKIGSKREREKKVNEEELAKENESLVNNKSRSEEKRVTKERKKSSSHSFASLTNAEHSRKKPKNFPSKGKNFALCSTNEVENKQENYLELSETPKIDKRLSETSFPMEDREVFIKLAENLAAEMPDEIKILDCWAVSESIFSKIMERYINRHKDEASKQRQMELEAARLYREHMDRNK